MANALSDFLGGFQAGDQITSNQREQRQQNQLARLAPQVVTGDPQAYAQAAAINPQAAQQYQQSGDQIAMKARGAAKYLQSALQSGNQQQIMAARQTIKPFMDTLKPGSSYPLDMDPTQETTGLQGFLAQTSYLDPEFKAGTPTDVRSFQMMTAGLSPEDRERARRVELGLEGRASNAGFGFELVAGPDGKQRLQRRNPRTGAVEQYDENSGDFIPMGGIVGGMQPQQAAGTVFRTSTGELIDVSKVTEPALRAEIMANPEAYGMLPDGAQATLPPRSVSPDMFVGRSKEQEAGAVTQAQEAAKIPYTAQEIGMRRDAALDQARGEAGIKAATDLAATGRANENAYRVYTSAMGNLKNALSGTSTNPVLGRLPAVTANQQIADGGVAAMAPVLKQMFRAAGEGTFTDSDQKLLMDMLPTRTDLPAARDAKIAGIDSIVRSKLNVAPSAEPPQTSTAARPQAAAGQQSSSYSDLWK